MITPPSKRYCEIDADNERWEGFSFRPGDIIISAPSKSGTTWAQLLVAFIVFDGPDFPAPISEMSPWMDHKIRSRDDAHAIFAAQEHRRFFKTHTPLDGVPLGDELVYVCVGRDPRDAAVSLVHHLANMRRGRIRELLAAHSDEPLPERRAGEEFDEAAYFDRFIEDDDPGPAWSIRFVAHHYRTFWERRHLPNVALFHFADLLADLPAEIFRLASHLGVQMSHDRAIALAADGSIDRARARANDIAPEANVELWKDAAAFFRSGGVGEYRDRMTPDQQDRYLRRVDELMSPDLAAWVHGGATATTIT